MSDSIHISLPQPLREFVEQQVAKGGFPNSDEYVQDLLRQERMRRAHAEVDAILLDAVAGPFAPLTEEDLDRVRHDAREGGRSSSRT
jgi:antitoxin ParD1/3/4